MSAFALNLRDQWRDATLRDAALLLLFAGLFWASKWTGKWIEHVPGHSGAFWIPVLMLSAGTLRRSGAATATALFGAFLWSFPKGEGSIAPYVLAGLVLDLLHGSRDRLRSLPVALGAGVLAHLAKFAFHNVPRLVLGVPGDFVSWGIGPAGALHAAFGLLGGLIGWLLLTLSRRRSMPAPTGKG